MPGFDGTGPRGAGPLTGRGMGYCVVPLGSGYQRQPAAAQPFSAVPLRPAYRYFSGRGLGLGRGGGRGCRRGRGPGMGRRRRW